MNRNRENPHKLGENSHSSRARVWMVENDNDKDVNVDQITIEMKREGEISPMTKPIEQRQKSMSAFARGLVIE